MRKFLLLGSALMLAACFYTGCSNKDKEEKKEDTVKPVVQETEFGDPTIDSLLNDFAQSGKALDSIYKDETAMKNKKAFMEMANRALEDQLQLEGYEIEMTEKQEKRYNKIKDRLKEPIAEFEEKYAKLYDKDPDKLLTKEQQEQGQKQATKAAPKPKPAPKPQPAEKPEPAEN